MILQINGEQKERERTKNDQRGIGKTRKRWSRGRKGLRERRDPRGVRKETAIMMQMIDKDIKFKI